MTDLDLIDRKIAAEPTPNATLPNAMPTKSLSSHLAMKRMTFSTDFPVDTRSR